MLSPELLKVLCEMGHSDTIVIADGNFPAESMGKNGIVLRMDGHGVPEILEAILTVFPLDQYIEKPVSLMEHAVHGTYQSIPFGKAALLVHRISVEQTNVLLNPFRHLKQKSQGVLPLAEAVLLNIVEVQLVYLLPP